MAALKKKRPAKFAPPRASMTLTIAKLVSWLTEDLGREPTDEEVAKVLAISRARVRVHRDRLAGGSR